MSSLSPLTTANILPPTIPNIGPALSSESEDEGGKPEKETKNIENVSLQIPSETSIAVPGI